MRNGWDTREEATLYTVARLYGDHLNQGFVAEAERFAEAHALCHRPQHGSHYHVHLFRLNRKSFAKKGGTDKPTPTLSNKNK